MQRSPTMRLQIPMAGKALALLAVAASGQVAPPVAPMAAPGMPGVPGAPGVPGMPGAAAGLPAAPTTAPIPGFSLDEKMQVALKGAVAAADAAEKALAQAKGNAQKLDGTADKAPEWKAKMDPAVAKATKALEDAKAAEAAAQALVNQVEDKAYNAARATAEGEVKRLMGEGNVYYGVILAELQLAAVPAANTAGAAIAAKKAMQPYLDAQHKVGAFIDAYNSLAINLANEVVDYTSRSKVLADQAVQEQSIGSSALAANHMIEAHKLLWIAKEKRARALKIRSLAERLNTIEPEYQQAALAAGKHASATFSFQQIDSKTEKKSLRSVNKHE
eukprot:TRINITY_DN2984_c0_g1_i1.p1 TRINITY_DN2984_c0_g1~~TRINITY_DN2984_c0_g1_i1.p1  ORF type:complete len:332 (-),score=127.44 TRINITY_DN2984_c0_g1_i1:161-1156(-)